MGLRDEGVVGKYGLRKERNDGISASLQRKIGYVRQLTIVELSVTLLARTGPPKTSRFAIHRDK